MTVWPTFFCCVCAYPTPSFTITSLFFHNTYTFSATFKSSLVKYWSCPSSSSDAMKVEEEDLVYASTHLLSSLLDQIPIIPSFKGKWAIVRSKLHSLRSQLADFTDFPTSSSNPLSLDLLRAISVTLSEAVSLAHCCQDPTASQGKLHTQSDLDALLAKLDRHIGDCEILFGSGVLQDGGSGSKREAVRAQSRNLITRLQIGSPDSQSSAMDSLLGLLHEDDKNVMIAVAQGVVPVLVRFMDSTSIQIREQTVAAISRVSMVESTNHVLVAEGLMLLNHLLRVLESGTGFAKERACVALQALSISRENAREIGCGGGISSLLEICHGGTPGSQAISAGVLRNLALVTEIREGFVEENAIVVLLGLAASGTALAQENAIGCLSNLVSDDENLKLLFVREGGVQCLNNFWDSAVIDNKSLEVAAELLMHLASCPPVAQLLVSYDFLGRLVGVLNCGVLGVRVVGARAVYELGFSTKTRKEMGESGCIAPLVKMLDGKAVEEKEAAAKALSVLVLYAGNRRILQREERGIVGAVQLLDPCVHNLDKRYPVSVLASLVHSKKCRKQMVAAGACLYLHKLVDMEVQGAKKLSESLGRSKIWGVFSRP